LRINIPTLQGNYYSLFDALYASITQDTEEPVTADDGIRVMKIINAAQQSSKERRVIELKE